MSNNPRIEQHHQQWSDLPLLEWPAVMQDDDITAWGDLLYMRGLVDHILDADTLTPERAHDILGGGERDGQGLIEYDIDLYLEPWTDIDRAADMLTAWRMASGPGPVQLPIAEAVSA